MDLIELIRQSEEATRKAFVAHAYVTHGGESPKVKKDKRKSARPASLGFPAQRIHVRR